MSNSSLTEDLRAYVSALADDVDEAVEFPVPRGRPGPSRHRLVVSAAAVAAVALVGAGVVRLVVAGDDGGLATEGGPPKVTSPPSASESPGGAPAAGPNARGPASVLPEAPLDLRGDVAVAWTGDELVVWGGDVEAANMGVPGEDRQYTDGAVYDPETDRWRPMSAGPLPSSADTPVAVATTDGVVIARGESVALWDPADDVWRALPSARQPIRDLAWTGDVVVSASANAVLDIGSDAWRAMESPPVVLERPTTAWTGSELVVMGGPSTPFVQAAAIALDPQRGTWRTLADPPSGLHAEALSASWDGGRVVVVNYDMQAVSFDPSTGTWTRIAPVPARFGEWYPTLESARGYSVAFMSQAVAVLRPDGRWLPLPYGDLRFGSTAVADEVSGATGPVLYTVGVDDARDRLVVTALDMAEAVDAPRSVQVGVAAIAVPDDFTFVSADFEGAGPGAEVVSVEVEHDGRLCLLTATHGVVINEDVDPMVIDETLPEAPGVTWRRNESGTAWATETSTTDTLAISCEVPDDAQLLARSAQT